MSLPRASGIYNVLFQPFKSPKPRSQACQCPKCKPTNRKANSNKRCTKSECIIDNCAIHCKCNGTCGQHADGQCIFRRPGTGDCCCTNRNLEFKKRMTRAVTKNETNFRLILELDLMTQHVITNYYEGPIAILVGLYPPPQCIRGCRSRVGCLGGRKLHVAYQHVGHGKVVVGHGKVVAINYIAAIALKPVPMAFITVARSTAKVPRKSTHVGGHGSVHRSSSASVHRPPTMAGTKF